MRAVKGNKVYQIDESQKKTYLGSGFDIEDEAGKVLEYGHGKQVPYNDFLKLQKENEQLREKLKKMEESPGKKAAKKDGE